MKAVSLKIGFAVLGAGVACFAVGRFALSSVAANGVVQESFLVPLGQALFWIGFVLVLAVGIRHLARGTGKVPPKRHPRRR